MAKNFFQPIGDFIGGAVTALQPGRVQQMQLERARIEQWIKSSEMQDLLRGAQTKAINEGRSVYGGRRSTTATGDPRMRFVKDINEIGTAENKFRDDEGEVDPSVADFFTGLTKSKVDEAKDFITLSEDKISPVDTWLKKAGGRKSLGRVDPPGGMTDRIATDLRPLFAGGNEFDGLAGPAATKTATKPTKDMSEFFQAPTELSPMDTVPKTLAQIGITAKDDIQTFGELEKKLPDMDLRSQYQINKVGFDKILSALRAGKTPDGEPFTIKDAIAFIQANQ